MKIILVDDNSLKKEICNSILRSLPNWFGIEASIINYVDSINDKDFFAASEGEDYIGFFAIDYFNNEVANLYVLGLKKEYHNKGIGTKLYNEVELYIKRLGYRYVTVHTLSAKSTDEYYARTRKFYKKLGFVESYESEKIWDANNPFLLMVKYIG